MDEPEFHDPEFGDLCLVFRDDKRLYVSRGILSIWSPVLKAMLFNSWSRDSLRRSGTMSDFASPSAMGNSRSLLGGGRDVTILTVETTEDEQRASPARAKRRRSERISASPLEDCASDGLDAPPASKRPRKEEQEVEGGPKRPPDSLSPHSPVEFAPLSSSALQRSFELPELHLPNEDADEFELFLKKLYPPCDLPVTHDNVEVLLRLSDQFGVERVRSECMEKLNSWPASLEKLALADRFHLRHIAQRCILEIVDGDIVTLQPNQDSEKLLTATFSKETLAQMFIETLGITFPPFLPVTTHAEHMAKRHRLSVTDGLTMDDYASLVVKGQAKLPPLRDAILDLYAPACPFESCVGCVEIRRMGHRKNGTRRPNEEIEEALWTTRTNYHEVDVISTGRKWRGVSVTPRAAIVFVPPLDKQLADQYYEGCKTHGLGCSGSDTSQQQSQSDYLSIRVYEPTLDGAVSLCAVRLNLERTTTSQLKQAIVMGVLAGLDKSGHRINCAEICPGLTKSARSDTERYMVATRAIDDEYYLFEEEVSYVWNYLEADRLLKDCGLRTGDVVYLERKTLGHAGADSPQSLSKQNIFQSHGLSEGAIRESQRRAKQGLPSEADTFQHPIPPGKHLGLKPGWTVVARKGTERKADKGTILESGVE